MKIIEISFSKIFFFLMFSFISQFLVAQEDTIKLKDEHFEKIDDDVYEKKAEDGYEKVDKDLYIMNLEALLNMEVLTVSKKEEKLSEAPAIVTIITPEKIEELGVQTLTELMTFVPGFSVKDTYWKRQIVTARGIKMSLYNDKILMLVNGIPAYDAAAMEHYLDLIPIPSIKRIEIIRGPGSTLYGTNAFSAVVNVITKDKETANGIDVYTNVGSFRTLEGGFHLSQRKEDLSLQLGATFKDNDGYLKENVVDEYGVTGKLLYEHDNTNLFANAQYKDFSLQTGYLFQKWGKFGPLPGFRFGNTTHPGHSGYAHHEKLFVNTYFEKEINYRLYTKIAFHFDWMDKQTDIGDFGSLIYQQVTGAIDTTVPPDYYRFGGDLYQLEGQVRYMLNDYFSLIGGASYETRISRNLADLYDEYNGKLLFPGSTKEMPFNVNDAGAYLQLDGKYKKLGYVAGVRFTYLGISEEVYLTPRMGLVYNYMAGSSLKILYGEAFRGAGPQEQYYKVPILIYGLDAIGKGLKPERIRTYEFAWDQKIEDRYKMRLNLFLTEVLDVINRRSATAAEIQIIDPTLPSTLIYDNLGEQTVFGGELELQAYPSKMVNLFANISYKDGEIKDENGITSDLLFMEKTTANAGVTLTFFNKLKVSPNFQYVGAREGNLTGSTDKFSVDAYGLINLTTSYKLNKRLSLSAIFKNMLDKEYFYPEDVRRNIQTIPGGPGFSFYVKLKYRMTEFN